MEIKELGLKYGLDNKKDVWELPAKKGTWIITHDAIEKIMAIENIVVDDIKVLNSEWDFCRLLVTCVKDGKKVTTIGEALLNTKEIINEREKTNYNTGEKYIQYTYKGNCESQYIGAMAEKRGIDRAVLKLIDAYQYGIYSDVESDDFKKQSTLPELATLKQLDLIRAYMDKSKDILVQEVMKKEFNKTKLPALTKVEASRLIEIIEGGHK